MISYAHDVEIGEIFYNLNDNTKEATVTYKGCNPNNEDYTRFVVIPSSITHNGSKYSVTGIGDCAFYNCIRLRDVDGVDVCAEVESSFADRSHGLRYCE